MKAYILPTSASTFGPLPHGIVFKTNGTEPDAVYLKLKANTRFCGRTNAVNLKTMLPAVVDADREVEALGRLVVAE